MNKFTLIFVLFFCKIALSQELYFASGKNSTKYRYTSSKYNSNLYLSPDTGNSYEFGYIKHFFKSDSEKFFDYYKGSITYNQFNANGGTLNSTYTWRTNYIGLQNVIAINLLTLHKEYVKLRLLAGMNLSTIIQGEQTINNVKYNIASQEDFKGVFFQPLSGLEARIRLTKNIDFSGTYSYSSAYKIQKKPAEKLYFINNQFQLGLIFNLK
jgi:hypothetical protein